MPASNQTAHYGLPQFTQNDVTGWISDLNPAMAAIDAGIWAAKTQADSAATAASDAATAAGQAQTLATQAKAGADSAQTTATAAQTAAAQATTKADAAKAAADNALSVADSAVEMATGLEPELFTIKGDVVATTKPFQDAGNMTVFDGGSAIGWTLELIGAPITTSSMITVTVKFAGEISGQSYKLFKVGRIDAVVPPLAGADLTDGATVNIKSNRIFYLGACEVSGSGRWPLVMYKNSGATYLAFAFIGSVNPTGNRDIYGSGFSNNNIAADI